MVMPGMYLAPPSPRRRRSDGTFHLEKKTKIVSGLASRFVLSCFVDECEFVDECDSTNDVISCINLKFDCYNYNSHKVFFTGWGGG